MLFFYCFPIQIIDAKWGSFNAACFAQLAAALGSLPLFAPTAAQILAAASTPEVPAAAAPAPAAPAPVRRGGGAGAAHRAGERPHVRRLRPPRRLPPEGFRS